MAYTTLTVGQVIRSGLALSPAAANVDGSYFKNDGRVVLYVVNGDASGKDVILTPTRRDGGKAIAADQTTIAAGAAAWLGPYPPELFNDALGNALVTFSAVTSLTLTAIRLG